jgi:hypothetical protein
LDATPSPLSNIARADNVAREATRARQVTPEAGGPRGSSDGYEA